MNYMRKKPVKIIGVGVAVVMAVTFLFGCGAMFIGCKSGGKKVSKVEINNMDIYYLPTSTIDFDSVTLTVTYEDGSAEELTSGECDVSENDIADGTEFILYTDGLYDLASEGGELSLGDYEISCRIPFAGYKSKTLMTVTVGDDYVGDLTPYYYDKPDLLNTYEKNLSERTGKDSEDSYYYAPTGYFVGDDNEFVFKPELIVKNEATGETGTFSDFGRDVTVTLVDEKTNATEDPLNIESAGSNDYVAVDGFSFDFTENAIGKTFTIWVSEPEGFTQSTFGRAFESFSLDVTVADGWNVTDATNLGRMALVSDSFNRSAFVNGNDEKSIDGGSPSKIYWDEESKTHVAMYTSDIWKNFLTEKGYDDVKPVNGIFLHDDITVKQSDLPEEFFISESEALYNGGVYDEMVGSIRDGVKIYEKNVEEDFTFNGNLFTVDCTSLKWAMTHLDSEFNLSYYSEAATAYRESSVVLFGFQGLTDKTATERATAEFRNVTAIGNGIDLNDVEGKAAGSVRFVESRSSQTEVNNCIVREFLSGFTARNSDDNYVNLNIDRTKIYDCYNFAIIVAKSASNFISNSEFKRFSCPAMTLMSDMEEGDEGAHSYSKAGLTVDANTTIESYLDGSEAWWTVNNAGSVAGYLSLADTFIVGPGSNYTKTILNEKENNKLNMMAVFQDSEYFGQGGTRLNTYYKYGDGVPFILNDTTWDSTMSNNGLTGEDLGMYNAAATNYFIDEKANSLFMMTFATNQGKLCSMDSFDGFYDPIYVASGYQYGQSGKIVLDEGDDQFYMYYDMNGIGLSIIIDLYNA